MSPRAQLVELLRSILPADWKVLDFDRDLGSIRKPTVTVQTTNIGSPLTFRAWQATNVVDLIATQMDYDAAETFLEDALTTFMSALTESIAPSLFAGAERIVRADKHHAWRITLTLPLKEA